MALSGATELIWHFAGYFRLPPEDYATRSDLYDGAALKALPEDGPAAGPVGAAHGYAPPHLISGYLHQVALVAPAAYHWHVRPIGKVHPLKQYHLPGTKLHLPAKMHIHPAPLDGGAWDAQVGLHINVTVSYQGGGDQSLIDLRQVNALVSDNQVDAPADVFAHNSNYAADVLASMLDQAQKAVPAFEQIPDNATDGLTQYVDYRDSHQPDAQAHDAPYAVQPGQYVNGTLYTGGADPHQVTTDTLNHTDNAVWPDIAYPGVFQALNAGLAGLPAPPTGDGSVDALQIISVGKDIAANTSLIANLEPLTTALAVSGNYYETKEIVQTNVFTEHNQFDVAGAVSNATIYQSVVQNIADFSNQAPTLTTSGSAGSIPTDIHWSVDTLNGSLLDIHSLVQTNYLINDNVIYQTDSSGHSQIIAGSNVQVNEAQFLNLTAKYDFIIVEGNYHQDDMIYQTNVLLDSNSVASTVGGTGSYSVSGGGNTVVNDGTIVDMGNHAFQSMSADAASVLQGLETHSSSLDGTQVINAFPQLLGNINVLIVTGDYYDVNYLSQTNVISNSNVVMVGGAGTQNVQTGHDVAVNSATIMDGGSATAPYLQGSYYNDMILIQTNIINDGTKITGQDPNHLAPELVAFTGTTDVMDQAAATPVASPIDLQHHNDVMSGVLH